MQDFDSCSELGGLLLELVKAGDLPSQPPVVKVADVALEVYKVAAGPDEEGAEPGGEWFNGVLLAMPNRVSLCIQVDNIRGLIRALLFMEPGDSTVFNLLDPFCWLEDSISQGNEEVGDLPIVFNVPVGGAFKYVFVVFDPIVESGDLLLEATDFDIFKSVASGEGCKEPFGDGSEDVGVEVRVCCQGGRNSIGRHRWFQTLDRADQERDAVLSG